MDTNSKKATAFVLEKLNSAGIEVITDKEEFDRILENEKILQKMTADLSEFENLSSQLTERKQEANELEYKKNKIIENKEKQKSEDFKNLNEKILNYEKYLPDDAVINLSRKNEVKNNTPEQTYQLIKSNGIMLYQTTSINEEQHSIYDILFNEEIEPKEFKSFYSNTDFSTLKNEIEDIIKDFLKDQIEKQKAKTEQLKNFIEHSKEFNNEEQHNDNILINLSNLEKSLFFNANFEINSKELNEEVSVFPGSTGKSGMGIRHIIEERFKKDNLTIDQITSLAALILDAVQTGKVTRESRNRCEFTKNGIIAIVKKNFDNSKINWILTGFAYKGESRNKEREATEAIQTVNARYGHSPEYSSFRIQVGAVITSLNQSITEATTKSSQDYIPDTQNGKMIVTSLKTELKPETHFIRNSSDVYKLLNEVADQEQEHFGVILLDTSHKVTAVKTLFIGTLNRSLVHPRDIFREALRANAAAIIVFHNHPSGTLYPSQEDINTTERLMRASRNIGIPLLDHLIVTKDNYRSLSDVMESIERKLDNEKNNEFLVQDGKTYGFVHEGKIYLNPEVMDSNVAVHEYTHLWDKYIQNTNPELWEKGKAVFKNTSLWKQVTSNPAYSDISGNDDLVLSECHARICGNLAKNVLEKIAREDGEITKDRIVDWDKETWEYLAKEFSEDMSELIQVKDFINLPIKDLMNGNKIQEFKMKNTYQKTTTNYLLDKLSKSGIEVSTDQKEFLDVLNYSREINSVKEMIDACSDSETPKNLTEENKIKYINNLNLLRDKIEASSMTPEEFLTDIQKACGIDSTLKSKYLYQRIDNNSFAIRISDHNTNEIGSVNDGKNPKIVIKLVSDTTNTNLEEIEYDSEISKDKMKGIISGLQDWLTKGVYTDYDYDHVHITPKDKIMQDISEEMTIGGLKKTIMTGVAAATMFCSIPNVAAQTEIIKQELLSSGTREMATREMGVLKVIQRETIKKEKITIKSTLEYVEFTDGSSVISNIDNKDGQLNISVILDNDGHPMGVAQYDSYKNFLEQKIQNGEAKKTILDNITTCIDGEKYKEFFENWTEIADSVTRNGGLYKIDNFQSSKDCVDLLNTWTLNNRNANVFQYFIEDSLTYGITYKNKIYLNPDLINANVIAHEYTHLWDKYIQNANPELWERGKAIFSKTCLWNEVKEDPAYLNISKDDDLVLSECHARICGKMAEEILNRIALENGGEIKEDVINWDKEVEKYIESEFGILRPDLSEDMSHLKETLEYEELKTFLSSPLKDIMSEKRIIQNEENISVPTVETEKETFVVIRESEGKSSVLVSNEGKFIFENTDGYPNAELLDKIQAEKITEELKLSEKNDVTYTVMGKSEFLEKFRKSSHEIITDEPGNKNQFKEEHNSQMLIEGETVLPKFSVITQNGLVTFEGAVLEKRNANEKSWTIRDLNGETMTIQDSTIYEIMDNAASIKKAPEENKENIKNGRNFEYLIKSQYKDFYELRPNTANNFIHNYEAYCRREANSPCDGLLIAKKIIEKMPSGEKNKIESLLKKRSINNGITVNEMLIERYHKAVSIVPINTREVMKIMDKEAVSYPYKEFKFHKGEKLSEDRDLIRNNRDLNLKIGDTISLSVAENKVFGKGKELISFDSLKVISASKDCNVITLMDSKKSLLELPLDSVLAEHKRQAQKEITRQQNKNTIKNAISR